MRRFAFALLLLSAPAARAQTPDDIPVEEVPAEVRAVLAQYIDILSTSKDLDECAERFTAIAGGNLVEEDGKSLRGGVQPYGLKKDYTDVKYYATSPLELTRATRRPSRNEGFGPSMLNGTRYTMWIPKRKGVGGVPAPISVVVPKDHAFVKTPKVTGIGSL